MDAKYNLSDLISRIKSRLKDADYSETDITQFINDTYFDVTGETKWRFLEKLSEYEAFESGILPLPRDFQSAIVLFSVKNKNPMQMKYLAPDDFLALGRGARCFKYTVIGNEILFGIPESESEDIDVETAEGYKMKLYYLSRPLPLIEPTDTASIPLEYSEILVLGALYRAEQLRDNFDYAQIYENKMSELLTNMIMRYGPRQLGEANRSRLPVSIKLEN